MPDHHRRPAAEAPRTDMTFADVDVDAELARIRRTRQDHEAAASTAAKPNEDTAVGRDQWAGQPHSHDAWPVMDGAAYHGLAGDVVTAIEPYSEADPTAILIQFLTSAGNIIGNRAYYQVEGTRHHANLFNVLVGESSKAR